MILIKEENFNRVINNQEVYSFEIPDSGLYLISVSAKCKNWLQNFKKLFNDDDFAIEIDGFPFFEFKGKRKEFASPSSWNGNEIKNLSKTNFYITPLSLGEHKVSFFTDQNPFLENIKIYKLELSTEKTLNIVEDFLPESKNNKLFFDIAVKNIKLNNIKVLVKADGKDKLGLEIDKKYKKLYWLGTQLKGKSKELIEEINSNDNLCYLEFKGIGKSAIKNIEFSVKEFTLNKIGKVALYRDIEPDLNFTKLRSDPDHEKENIILQIPNGEKVEILQEVVEGSYVNNLSHIWHKIKYKESEGFVLSSYIEIEGQERDRVIALIKQKAKEVGIDENMVLSVAGCESKYKPYARGYYVDNPKNAGRGIFQINEWLQQDLNNSSKPFYSPIGNLFDFKDNIIAGVIYFNYLYNKVYKNSSDKLLKSVVYYNVGPTHAPTEKEKLNLSLYKKDVRTYCACVSENLKTKNWQKIFWPTLLVVLSAGFLWSFNYFNNTNNLNYYVASISDSSEKYKLYYKELENQSKKVSLNEEGNEILFFDDNKNIIYKMPFEDLGLDKILQSYDDYSNEKHRVYVDRIKRNKDKIYFTATNRGYCGAMGCTYVIYQFNLEDKKLKVLNKKIFGGIHELAVSPDNSRALLVYASETANGCGNSYTDLIDLTSFVGKEIKIVGSKDFSDEAIESVLWKNNNEIEFSVRYWNCGGDSNLKPRNRQFIYNLQTQKILIEKEEIIYGAG